MALILSLRRPEQQAAYKALAAVTLADDKAANYGKDSELGTAFATAAKEQAATIRQEDRQEKREAFDAKAQEDWKEWREAHVESRNPESLLRDTKDTALKVMGIGLSLGDFATSLLAGSSSQPKQTPSQVEQIKAQRQAYAALERIHDSIERGEDLQPVDIKSLTPTHIENLSRNGSPYMLKLVEALKYEKEREREDDWGRGSGR